MSPWHSQVAEAVIDKHTRCRFSRAQHPCAPLASWCIAAIYLHLQAGSKYSAETPQSGFWFPKAFAASSIGMISNIQFQRILTTICRLWQILMTIIPFHIFMAFNSLQSAFTYIITLNPSEIDSFFSILLAAQWSGKSSEPDLSSNPGNDPHQPASHA